MTSSPIAIPKQSSEIDNNRKDYQAANDQIILMNRSAKFIQLFPQRIIWLLNSAGESWFS